MCAGKAASVLAVVFVAGEHMPRITAEFADGGAGLLPAAHRRAEGQTGFPGETDEDHRKSVELIRKLHADTV